MAPVVEGEVDAADVYNEHRIALRDEDVEYEAVSRSFAAAAFRPGELHNIQFVANLEGRLRRFKQTGEVDEQLITQLTQG